MALICDSGAVYALYDADDTRHPSVRTAVEAESGPLYLPVMLVAEIDYLLTTRLSVDAELEFLEGIQEGSYSLVLPTSADLGRCREVMEQYRDLRVGIADASVVATAERLQVQRLLTLDHRHFRT